MQEPNFNQEQFNQKAEIKEHLEGLVRLVADVFLQGVMYENYVHKVMGILQKDYNITTYKFLTCEDESALITENALTFLKQCDLNFKSCREKYSNSDRNLIGPRIDLVEIREKYSNQGIDVLLDGAVPIVGKDSELHLVRKTGVDDFYQALKDLLNPKYGPLSEDYP